MPRRKVTLRRHVQGHAQDADEVVLLTSAERVTRNQRHQRMAKLDRLVFPEQGEMVGRQRICPRVHSTFFRIVEDALVEARDDIASHLPIGFNCGEDLTTVLHELRPLKALMVVGIEQSRSNLPLLR